MGKRTLGEPGKAREFQTRIFAPPLMGALQKTIEFVRANVGGGKCFPDAYI